MYNCIIIGSGFCGSVLARRIAEECNKKVLVLERRSHVGGNMYDEYDVNGILVQRYGPHVFHTNNKTVYEFVERFAQLKPYTFRCSAEIDGKNVPSPFNFQSIDLMYGETEAEQLKRELLRCYPGMETISILQLLKSENPCIKSYADMLFEKDYRLYTAKQWGLSPDSIDVSILERVPVVLSYRDSFFNDTYECLPVKGYTDLFENMLSHENITVVTDCDALGRLRIDPQVGVIYFDGEILSAPLIYTGAIDELFDYQYGKLPYRALHFEYKILPIDRYIQETPIAVYPQRDLYTRITEYKTLQGQQLFGKTLLAYEYPLEHDPASEMAREPYYPVINDENMATYRKYHADAQKVSQLTLCGRLAEYRYYNMDNAIERAFEVFEEIRNSFNEGV